MVDLVAHDQEPGNRPQAEEAKLSDALQSSADDAFQYASANVSDAILALQELADELQEDVDSDAATTLADHVSNLLDDLESAYDRLSRL
jgi:uncharacterized protein Yka (UPF0111/DUF47 family)